MIIRRNTSILQLIIWTWRRIAWLLASASLVALLYHYNIIYVELPWLPISVIGTAVAFYVGFKNNSAYDRVWEARKIWGGIVNDSRTWGMMVDSFVTNLFAKEKMSDEQIASIKKRLIYRHIGWLYAHRSQLLIPTPWESISQEGSIARRVKKYQETYGVGLVGDEVTRTELKLFLPEGEHDRLINYKNTATQIINEQGRDLRELREQGLIEDFRHMEMANVLKSFYTLQGKNERIKKFPLPRQYSNMSFYFVMIFLILLPFSMIPTLMNLTPDSHLGLLISVPLTVLVGWVYLMMEMVGNTSENPFQGLANDIPMLSLCRVIEIDLREMLGETDLPLGVQAKNGILM